MSAARRDAGDAMRRWPGRGEGACVMDADGPSGGCPPRTCGPGDRFAIRPAETIAADGVVEFRRVGRRYQHDDRGVRARRGRLPGP